MNAKRISNEECAVLMMIIEEEGGSGNICEMIMNGQIKSEKELSLYDDLQAKGFIVFPEPDYRALQVENTTDFYIPVDVQEIVSLQNAIYSAKVVKK